MNLWHGVPSFVAQCTYDVYIWGSAKSFRIAWAPEYFHTNVKPSAMTRRVSWQPPPSSDRIQLLPAGSECVGDFLSRSLQERGCPNCLPKTVIVFNHFRENERIGTTMEGEEIHPWIQNYPIADPKLQTYSLTFIYYSLFIFRFLLAFKEMSNKITSN